MVVKIESISTISLFVSIQKVISTKVRYSFVVCDYVTFRYSLNTPFDTSYVMKSDAE